MATLIYINGLEKAAVLAALYNASKQQGMGFMDLMGAKPNIMTVEEAREELKGALRSTTFMAGA